MQTSRLQAVVLAALCIAAVGVSATTIESSLSTDPDDVIDIDLTRLPIGGDSLVDAKEEMESNADPDSDGEEGSDGDDESNGESATEPSENGDRTESVPEEADESALEEVGGEAGEEVASAAAGVGDELGQEQGPGKGLLERLLDLLRLALVVVLAIGALLILLAVGYRYADRIHSLFAGDDERTDGPPWPPAEPADEVAQAWLAMVRRIDVDRPRSLTPEEWASAATDAGMDPEAVDALTRTFAEVRYGDEPSTASRRQRAWSSLERLRTALDGGSQ